MSKTTFANQAEDPSPPAEGCVTIYSKADAMYAIDDEGVVSPLGSAAHDLGGASHNADTLANLNAKVSDATLDDASDPRTPSAHAHSHASTTGQGTDDHHAQSHAHSSHTGIGTDDHHAQSHSHGSHSGIGTDDHHAQAHTVVSHSDTTATGAEMNTLVGGGATALHSHAVAHTDTTGKTANDHHNEAHTVASHSDTTATGAELDELTDASETTLHSHATPDLQAVCDEGASTTTALTAGLGVMARGAAEADGAGTINDFVGGAVGTNNHAITLLTSQYADIGVTGVAGTRNMCWRYRLGISASLYIGGNTRLNIGAAYLKSNSDKYMELGGSTRYFKRGFISHLVVGVLTVGDASAAIDDEEHIVTQEPAAGTNDLTVIAAVSGAKHRVRITAADTGSVRWVTTGGDTINGGASPYTFPAAPAVYDIIAETANDWRVIRVE